MPVMYVPPAPDLKGTLVALSALRITDAEALAASATDPEVWQGKLVPRPTSVDEVREMIAARQNPQRQLYAVRRLNDGVVIGSTSLGNFDFAHRCVEMGFTWLARDSWGSGCNEDMKFCLLEYCFEQLELARVEWQMDSLNERSRRSLQRMRFTYEGTLRRRHVRPDGTRRDSLIFSLLVDEWPDAREHLRQLAAFRAGAQPRPGTG